MTKPQRPSSAPIVGAEWERALAEAAERVFGGGDSAVARWFATAAPADRARLSAVFEQVTRGERPFVDLLSVLGPEADWVRAIGAWREGDDSMVSRLLAGADPIPAFARSFLAALATGQVKRKRGVKSAQRSLMFADLMADMRLAERIREAYSRHHRARKAERKARGAKRGDLEPSRQAIDDVAQELSLTVHQVEAVVHRGATPPRARSGRKSA